MSIKKIGLILGASTLIDSSCSLHPKYVFAAVGIVDYYLFAILEVYFYVSVEDF